MVLGKHPSYYYWGDIYDKSYIPLYKRIRRKSDKKAKLILAGLAVKYEPPERVTAPGAYYCRLMDFRASRVFSKSKETASLRGVSSVG